ncbi:MAG: hypothetical protein Alpg2KO_22660 [Alphaproteobacteria bacterium]
MSRLLTCLSRPVKDIYSAGARAIRPLRRVGLTMFILGSLALSGTAHAGGFVNDFMRNMPNDPFHAENPVNDLRAAHFECLNCPPGQKDPGEPVRGSAKAGYIMAAGLGGGLLMLVGAGAVGRRRQAQTKPASEPRQMSL